MRVVILMVVLAGCARAQGDARREAEPQHPATEHHSTSGPLPAEGPLVIELFTSQGCSSCPPADRLLGKIARTGVVEDRVVVPLSLHVDYWNGLGWSDPFSRPEWTERQQQYGRALPDHRVYTPELVVGGAASMVGSQVADVMAAIAAAPRPARLAATGVWSRTQLVVTASAPADADVWIAIWETTTSTDVTRGENSGQTLASDHVVRRLERVAGAGHDNTITVTLDPVWRDTGAVAFAQRSDRRIVASALIAR